MQTSECPSREGIPTISLMVEFPLLAEWKSPFMQAGPSKLGKPSLGNHRHPSIGSRLHSAPVTVTLLLCASVYILIRQPDQVPSRSWFRGIVKRNAISSELFINEERAEIWRARGYGI